MASSSQRLCRRVFVLVAGPAISLGCAPDPKTSEVEAPPALPSEAPPKAENVEVQAGPLPPAIHEGTGPAPTLPPGASVEAQPLSPDPRLLESRWFRPGVYEQMSVTETLELGLVAVGEDPELGPGVSRIAGTGELLWHQPGAFDRCRLSTGGNTVCMIEGLEFVAYDERGREVWNHDFEALVADAPPKRSPGFGATIRFEFDVEATRVVGDVLFVAVGMWTKTGSEHPRNLGYSLLCLGLDGQVHWVEGSQVESGIPWARAAPAFYLPSPVAEGYADSSLPEEPPPSKMPEPAVVTNLRNRYQGWVQWLGAEPDWFVIEAVGPKRDRWRRQTLTHIRADQESPLDYQLEAPIHHGIPQRLGRVYVQPGNRLYGLWNDGTFEYLGREYNQIKLTYARSLAMFNEAGRPLLLVLRRPVEPPEYFEEREPGVEFFALPADW